MKNKIIQQSKTKNGSSGKGSNADPSQCNPEYYDHLMSLAVDCARMQLTRLSTFQHVLLFAADSRIGCVWAERDGSADPFKHFIEAAKNVAIAHNATAGVLIERLERVHVNSPEACPISPVPSVTEYVLLIWQSRTGDQTVAYPVNRKSDGSFSDLGQVLYANPLQWVANIIPQQDPEWVDRMTSKILLEKYNLNIEFQTPSTKPNP